MCADLVLGKTLLLALVFVSSIWSTMESPWYGEFTLTNGCRIKHMNQIVALYDVRGQTLAQGTTIDWPASAMECQTHSDTLHLLWNSSPEVFYAGILAFMDVDTITPLPIKNLLTTRRSPRPAFHKRPHNIGSL